jgi:hypothetical protein
MGLYMRAIGKMTKSTERDDLLMQLVMFTKVNGKIIWVKGMENTHVQMEINMKDFGYKINKMERV